MPQVFVVSLGCPKNLVDTERVMADVTRAGFPITSDISHARIVIINTCGFVEQAEQESYETIEEFIEMKRAGDIDLLIVWGCLVSRRGEGCRLCDPSRLVDAWLPVAENGAVARTMAEKFPREGDTTGKHAVISSPTNRLLATPPHTAYLRIADGCDNRCSYCTIPSIRGAFRSRRREEIVDEAHALAQTGTVELNLIAQDTTRYGADLYGEPKLDLLLQELSEIEPLQWIRVLYAHPAMVTEPLIEAMASLPKVCRYLDLPIQHASDPILNSMKRRVTRKQLEDIVNVLRAKIPEIVLRTTVMVGYPGETKKDFETLVRFLKETQFDHVGIFAYSDEDGTEAFDSPSHLPQRTIEQRCLRINQQVESDCEERKSRLLGETVPVLIDGQCEGEQGWFHGRWEGQAPDIDGHVYAQNTLLQPGNFYPILLTHLVGTDFTGAFVESDAP